MKIARAENTKKATNTNCLRINIQEILVSIVLVISDPTGTKGNRSKVFRAHYRAKFSASNLLGLK